VQSKEKEKISRDRLAAKLNMESEIKNEKECNYCSNKVQITK
jgi:hypothetical protein